MLNNQNPLDVSLKDIYRLRLQPFVEQRIAQAKGNVFLDQHSREEWLTHLVTEMMKHRSLDQFLTMSDTELKSLVGRRMSIKLVAGMLNDFSPEQMRTFDECLVRR